MRARAVSAAIAAAAIVALAGCGHSSTPGALARLPAPSAVPTSTSSHIAVIVMENKEIGDVIGPQKAGYLASLARRSAVPAQAFAITHPSLPNYLALTGGSTFGVSSDCTGCHQAATNLVDQLEAAGISWKAYMEGMPRPCFKGAQAGSYAKKHDPFMYYDDIANNPARCAKVTSDAALASDLRSGSLPTFLWLSPDLCDDTHDCPVATGDRYLGRVVPPLLRALGPHGVLFVTWDEGTSDRGCCGGLARGGSVATVIAGPDVRRGVRFGGGPYTHYGTLRTIEEILGLPPLRNAGSAQTQPLDAAFVRVPRFSR